MSVHGDEYRAALHHEVTRLSAFPGVRPDQREALRVKARDYLRWLRAHHTAHNALNIVLLCLLFAADAATLVGVPHVLGLNRTAFSQVLAGAVAGIAHGWLVSGIVTFTVHEGAAHDRIVLGQGPVARALRAIVHQVPRLFFAVPEYYEKNHGAHHRALGTEDDGSFSHYVLRRRLFLALLPAAPAMKYADFFPWRPLEPSASGARTILLSNAMLLGCLALAYVGGGPLYAAVSVLGVGGWLGFALDRLREATEHAYMPLDTVNGTRELGLGFFGLFVGGGPWGQPCHLTHHLEPALPWYQQLALHRHLVGLLDESQRRAFLLRPCVGFPLLVMRVFHNRSLEHTRS